MVMMMLQLMMLLLCASICGHILLMIIPTAITSIIISIRTSFSNCATTTRIYIIRFYYYATAQHTIGQVLADDTIAVSVDVSVVVVVVVAAAIFSAITSEEFVFFGVVSGDALFLLYLDLYAVALARI